MPIYEYECQACKFYTEVMQKISDAPLIKCPSCGKRRLKKLVSAPVFRLKGGGWYETDFKSDKEAKRNLVGADKEEAPKAEAPKAEAKDAKDAKPAEVKPAETKATDAKASPAKPAAGKAATPARRPAKSVRRKSRARPRR
jgi:putative FmdB family regulatory protein